MVKDKRFWIILFDNGPDEPFCVNIGLKQLVFDLKKMIRSSLNPMRQYNAQDISLYGVSTFQVNLILCSSTHGR